MGFFKTLFTGYKIMFSELNRKHNDLIPRCFTGCGTGLMMIGSAVMAKTAMKDDTAKLLAEADAAIEEALHPKQPVEKKNQRKLILKAKMAKSLKVVKVFRKGILMEAGGAVMNGAGYVMAEHGKHTALKAVGTLGATFASYRAAVREDLGEEADLKYLTGKKAPNAPKHIDADTGEVVDDIVDDGGVTINKDPNAFRFWFSKETCPSIWVDNYDLRKSRLEWVENTLTLKLQGAKHLSLNEMRREFGGLKPSEMDVGIGGIFGRVIDPNRPTMEQRVDLHFRDDPDFMEGRTDSCWIIFDCDPDPIVNKINKKIKQVEC